MWVVMNLHTTAGVRVNSLGNVEIPLVWASGMIGVLPVFENKPDAEAYAGETSEIVECNYRVGEDEYITKVCSSGKMPVA